jgi:hypothetical protein
VVTPGCPDPRTAVRQAAGVALLHGRRRLRQLRDARGHGRARRRDSRRVPRLRVLRRLDLRHGRRHGHRRPVGARRPRRDLLRSARRHGRGRHRRLVLRPGRARRAGFAARSRRDPRVPPRRGRNRRLRVRREACPVRARAAAATAGCAPRSSGSPARA